MDPNQSQPATPPPAEHSAPATPPEPEHKQLPPLSPLASLVVNVFTKHEEANNERKVTVNPFVSKVATAYEKLRNAMEYREEEVVLRATIERILRRRLLLGGTAKTTAEPLVRELIWARYLPDNTVPESAITKVEQTIDLYLTLRMGVLEKHRIKVGTLNDWIYQLMSSAIEHALNPNEERQTMTNFMYQVMKDDVAIVDDTEETRDAQVYLAVRRAFARDDIAFLRYHLFLLYFGQLTDNNVHHVAQNFLHGLKEITHQLQYSRKDKIYSYIKKRAAAFFILEDVLHKHSHELDKILELEDALKQAVFADCRFRYQGIAKKVRTAVIRSVIFILMTKVIFAFAIEGTYERVLYGHIMWNSILINTSIPPLLMLVVSIFFRPPGEENSRRILAYIHKLLFDEKPQLGPQLLVKKNADKPNIIFTILWLSAFLLSFGAIVFVLTSLHFTVISQCVFIFFITVVSFLAYRISLAAHLFNVGEKQDVLTPFIDFLFLPVVRVGRRFTQSISQVNFILFVFDFFIETPFKVFFAFVEQWFKFLHEKSEDLG